jgi:hypothetical protein
MHHTGTENLDPPGLLAEATTCTITLKAGDIYFDTWFGKGKETGS